MEEARSRGWGVVLAAVASALLAVTAVSGYVRSEIDDREAFANRAVSSLDDRSVRQVVAERVVDGIAERVAPEALAARPLAVQAVAALVDTTAFQRLLARAIRARQEILVDGRRGVSVKVAVGSGLVLEALRSVSPRLADAIPRKLDAALIAIGPRDVELRAARTAHDVAAWWWPLVALTLLAAIGCAALSGSSRGAVRRLGVALFAAGVTVATATMAAGAFVVLHGASALGIDDELEQEALEAVWTALFGDLRDIGLVGAVAGLLVTLAAIWPLRSAIADAPHRRSPVPATAAAVLAVLATGAAVALLLPGPGGPPAKASSPSGACNGSRSLCDKRLNEVVFPSTHNSYAAAAEPGWLIPNQRHGIARQLEDGIRGLMLDIHFGVRDGRTGRIRTDLEAEGGSRNKIARQLSPQALRRADRLAGRVGLGKLQGSRQPYLCHTACELGAEPLVDELRTIGRFLDDHPRDVIVVFVEPYVPVETIERALDDAGLLDHAAHLRRDRPLPTLRELGRANRRLVVLTEKDGGSRPWYLDGFAFAQDTPLGARSAGELRCAANRGTADSPLFLVNHWTDTFPPSARRNERIGGRVLADRLRRCRRARGLLPNLVAVDFYERTDVVAIVRRLNGS